MQSLANIKAISSPHPISSDYSDVHSKQSWMEDA